MVLVVAVAYIFAAVLDQPLTSQPVEVKVELAQTGGLFEGSAVTYRGVKVGKVTKILPADDGVLATVSITTGTDIPKDSVARVRSLSPVGEQYLDFQPEKADGPFLATGDVIPAESTDLPKSLSSTVIAVNNVLRQIDDKKLRIVLGELSTGLSSTGEDLGRILDQGSAILATLDAVWPETDRLITNAGTVLSIPTDNADSLRQLADSSKKFASTGTSSRPSTSGSAAQSAVRKMSAVTPATPPAAGLNTTSKIRSRTPEIVRASMISPARAQWCAAWTSHGRAF